MDRRTVLVTGLAAVTPLSSVDAQRPAQIEDICSAAAMSGAQASQLCDAVNSQIEETIDFEIGTRFNYQSRMYHYSFAHPRRDPPLHLAKKIQHFWAENQNLLTCNLLGFSAQGGSVLKLAIARNSADFIDDVVHWWGLWLNWLDVTGQTTLDFIESEMVRSQGTPNENIMRGYQKLFQRCGAKRAAELTPADQPIDPFELEIRPLLQSWDRACYFNGGRAAVKRGKLWGYVDSLGRAVVPPRYDGAFAFSQDRAAVNKNGRWGYIDPSGQEVIPLRYLDARVFGPDGFAEVTTDGRTWIRIDKEGQ